MRSFVRWRAETLHHLSDEMARALPPELDFSWPLKQVKQILSQQVVLTLPYHDFSGIEHRGQLVVHAGIAEAVEDIFERLFDEHFPLASMAPISAFAWDDHRSMAANNCVGFHFRKKTGKDELSWHAYGRAVDINPLLNPYQCDGVVLPTGAFYDPGQRGACGPDSLPVQLFKAHGFTWGGNWTSLQDYMHFERPLSP